MQISVTFRHMDPSEPLRRYATEKVTRVKKYLFNPLEANITLSAEKHRQIAEVNILANRVAVNGKEETDDMYSSIDLVMDKVERQVRRHKEKKTRRKASHNEHISRMEENSEPLEVVYESTGEDIEDRIVRIHQEVTKPMNLEEAVMQMDILNNEFLVFTNSRTNAINVIYKRKDGRYGLIEPKTI